MSSCCSQQKRIEELEEGVLALRYMETNYVDSWFSAFKAWHLGSANCGKSSALPTVEDDFYKALHEFLDLYPFWRCDIIFEEECANFCTGDYHYQSWYAGNQQREDSAKACLNFGPSSNASDRTCSTMPGRSDSTKSSGKIKYSRMRFRHTDLIRDLVTKIPQATVQIEAMKELFDLIDRENKKQWDFQVRVVVDAYIKWEMLSGILWEALMIFSGALIGVLFVSTLLLPNVVGVFVVVLNVLMVDADLMGLCYFLDIDFNLIVLLGMLMAIGLVVDFSAHMAHRYLHIGREIKRLSPEVIQQKMQKYNIDCLSTHKMQKVFAEMGVNILLGGGTTLASVSVLAFASAMFVVFCKTMVGLVLYGLAHGLCFCPVLLAALDP